MKHDFKRQWPALALVAFGVCLSSAIVLAQAPAPTSPSAPTPDTSTPADPRQDPRSTGSARPGETLSERLDRSDGVIRPAPNITPDNTIRPPDTGTTPVIPPPGSPGGDPRIIPK
jgi:hypothetical protein